MITDLPLVALMVKQADCQAVILFDPEKGVVSNAHCGWRGNVHNILDSVVGRMKSEFGCRKADLLAAIGPSLGPCCAEFVNHEKEFPAEFRRFMVREGYFDLWEISRWQLLEAGLKEDRIEVANICSRCRTDMFFSYRAEGITGRFATVAMLKG
jgi:YfiH family protein